MREKLIYQTKLTLYVQFREELHPILILAESCKSVLHFKQGLYQYVSELSHPLNSNQCGIQCSGTALLELISNDGKTIKELSTGKSIKLNTIGDLWHFLRRQDWESISEDFIIDLYRQFKLLSNHVVERVGRDKLQRWMRRWPSGLDRSIVSEREKNKERIVELLVRRIERHYSTQSRYRFTDGMSEHEKWNAVLEWWNSSTFQLAMAIKTPTVLNRYLGSSLSAETMERLQQAYLKGIPFFITPYYASLLSIDGVYDDATIRSYVIYSHELVTTYGNIHAWEKEDKIECGKPNAAGWLLPDGGNIHRRYPEVAILIPDSMGRACGGLCASCQRLYDFQSERFNFNLEELKPKESWPTKLERLMRYFEEDTQLRDILITGGDALMSQNGTLRQLLESILKMASRKRKANKDRPDGEKFAELQRVRLGSRLPAYLPMRIQSELVEILRQFKERGEALGIKQFIIQTHFQSPLEVTPEARKAVERLQSAGWIITNQLVFNVAASRRGHTAKLRQVLNQLGVMCYYTFTVKGFEENYALFAPNSRSAQEQCEEKVQGILSETATKELSELLQSGVNSGRTISKFMERADVPFLATDRNVLNLPGIGKSMTFKTVGILPNGKRVLEFEQDGSRQHSPTVKQMKQIYIAENKSIAAYLRQLESMGEDGRQYESIWGYSGGKTEERFELYVYPELGYTQTPRITHIVEYDEI